MGICSTRESRDDKIAQTLPFNERLKYLQDRATFYSLDVLPDYEQAINNAIVRKFGIGKMYLVEHEKDEDADCCSYMCGDVRIPTLPIKDNGVFKPYGPNTFFCWVQLISIAGSTTADTNYLLKQHYPRIISNLAVRGHKISGIHAYPECVGFVYHGSIDISKSE